MKPDKNNRIKQQENGLLEPHTVMLDRPVVVKARSAEEAVAKAKERLAQSEEETTNTADKPEAGDGRSSIR